MSASAVTEKHHDSILSNLNPEQLRGVKHTDGPILVLAGAGSGKTRVLTRRVAHLVHHKGVNPERILAVTFTNKATREMKERLYSLLGSSSKPLWVSTFHSAGLRILRHHAEKLSYTRDFAVYDPQDVKNIVKGILKQNNIDEKQFPPSMFIRVIDQAKNQGYTPELYKEHSNDYGSELRADVYSKYQRALLESNAMDFGDLLLNVLTLFKKHPEVLKFYQNYLQYVLVDEFQDTNLVQYEIIRLITEKYRNLFVVGDDDQSIYAFRGATIRNILEFEKDFPDTEVVKLEQNYRSTANVLDAAHAVIKENDGRKPKKLWTSSDAGEKIGLYLGRTESDEAKFIAKEISTRLKLGLKLSDIAIFYRTNALSRSIEEALVEEGLPYKIYGGQKFYERKEIKDILAYLRLILSPRDNQAFLRAVNTPTRGIGARTIKTLTDRSRTEGLSLFEAASESGNKKLQGFVQLIKKLAKEVESTPLPELILETIESSDYGPRLKAKKDVTSESRLENLKELAAIGLGFAGSASGRDLLQAFLDRVTLTGGDERPEDTDEGGDDQQDQECVTLMTLHLAKGLEFPLVFMIGFEEGLLPHYRSLKDPTEIEEERRLCYVGITRAMKELILTRARTRGMFSAGGGFGMGGGIREPSRFAFSLPEECTNHINPGFLSDTGYDDDYTIEFDDEYLQADDEIDNFNFGMSNKKKKKQKSSAQSTASLVKAADEIASNYKGDVADPETLHDGMRVVHPSFGPGTIDSISGDLSGDPKKVRVVVLFDNYDGLKKLILKYAKLAAE